MARTVRPCSRRSWSTSFQHLLLVADVERAGRLVEQQQRRALGERAGEEHPLPFAAGEGGQLAAVEAGEVQPAEHLVHGVEVGGRLPAQRRDVRGAAEQHVVQHRHAGRHHRGLCHGGHHPGAVPAAQRGARRTEQGDRPRRGQQAADGAQQGGLAGAVRADHGDPLADGDGEVDAGQDRRAAEVDVQPAHLDGRHTAVATPGGKTPDEGPLDGAARRTTAGRAGGGFAAHVSTRRAVRSTRTKNGPPSRAVTTPIGSSDGAATVRATTSVSARNAPPNSSDSGRITR